MAHYLAQQQALARCLANQQTLALAMASHARLGAESPAAKLPSDCARRIAEMVRLHHAHLHGTVRLVSIRVKTGNHVDCLELCYSDGSSRMHGGVGGRWREPLWLQPGEYLTRISGAGEPLGSVRFDTSQGRSVRYAGQLASGLGGDAPFELTAPRGHEVRLARLVLRRSHLTASPHHILRPAPALRLFRFSTSRPAPPPFLRRWAASPRSAARCARAPR